MDKIQKNIPLAEYTTFRIGGPAEYFLEIKEKQDLIDAYAWANEHGKNIILLGGGSNVLINDNGVRGLVLKPASDKITAHGARLTGSAGVNLTRATRVASNAGLSGLEWAGGIPGATLGGAIRGNAGAFGMDMGLLVENVEVFDSQDETGHPFSIFSNKDCRFDYRTSIFKQTGRYVIWNTVLKMKRGEASRVKEETGRVIEKRRRGQPNLPNAGCIFKNFSYDQLKEANGELLEHAENTGAVNNGKIGAGWVIDLLGLKGKIIGGAKISLEHANFIVNTGKATSMDIIALIRYIKKEAKEKLNLDMEEEIQYIGFNS
jgi:UDP-N-acetylmuramate dehydrogenase